MRWGKICTTGFIVAKNLCAIFNLFYSIRIQNLIFSYLILQIVNYICIFWIIINLTVSELSSRNYCHNQNLTVYFSDWCSVSILVFHSTNANYCNKLPRIDVIKILNILFQAESLLISFHIFKVNFEDIYLIAEWSTFLILGISW